MSIFFLTGCATFRDPYPYDRSQTGCVKGNCVDGTGVYVYPDDDIYEGNWKNGRFHGSGTYYIVDNGDWKEMFKRIGTWNEGNKHGEFRFIDANGTSTIEYWRNDKDVTSYVKNCRTAKSASNAYKGFVSILNVFVGAAGGGLKGAVEGGVRGYDRAVNN